MNTEYVEENDLDIEEVILQYWPQINYRVKKSLGFNHTEWEDVASEILFDVVKALKNGKFRGESSVGTFIYVITSRRIVDYIRKKSKNINYNHEELSRNYFSDPFEIVNKKEQKKLVSNSIKKLKPRDADILYLYYYAGSTQKEIAQIFGISSRRVHEVMKNAKQSLKKIIQSGNAMSKSALVDSSVMASP